MWVLFQCYLHLSGHESFSYSSSNGEWLQGERLRLYVSGTIPGYKRSKSNQYLNTSLIQVEWGEHTREGDVVPGEADVVQLQSQCEKRRLPLYHRHHRQIGVSCTIPPASNPLTSPTPPPTDRSTWPPPHSTYLAIRTHIILNFMRTILFCIYSNDSSSIFCEWMKFWKEVDWTIETENFNFRKTHFLFEKKKIVQFASHKKLGFGAKIIVGVA